MPIRLYHPNLEPPHNECEVHNEAQVAILGQSGWERAPEPEPARPGYEPEPVQYAPVTSAKTKRGTKTEPVKGEDS